MPGAEAQEFALVRDFAVIMTVAGAAILLFRKLKQPPILGYLIAGVVVGPFTLPLLGLQAPVTNADSIRLLADLGLVLLLFAVGLEFGWQRIRQMGLRVILIGAIEITFMVALGYEIGILLGWTATEAFFLGAALSISSSAIIVKMLRDTGQMFKPHGRLIIGILVVEDFAAVVLLSILSAVGTTGRRQPRRHRRTVWQAGPLSPVVARAGSAVRATPL
jgi:CPA2 family monovalent cation:H+ antiporter-2